MKLRDKIQFPAKYHRQRSSAALLYTAKFFSSPVTKSGDIPAASNFGDSKLYYIMAAQITITGVSIGFTIHH